MDAHREPNGVNRAASWSNILMSGLMLIAAAVPIFYVAFRVQSDSELISVHETQSIAMRVQIQDVQLKLIGLELSLKEIETQFCEEGNLRNQMHARDERDFAIVFEKSFPGQHWHTDNAFYPKTCNRKTD